MKTFFTFGSSRSLLEQLQIILMIGPKVLAGLRETGTAGWGRRPSSSCFLAGPDPKIRRRPAHIVDITLEIRLLGEKLRLLHDGFVASGLNDPPLMEGQRTETASSKAATVAHESKILSRRSPERRPVSHRRGDRSACKDKHKPRPSPPGSRARRAGSVPHRSCWR